MLWSHLIPTRESLYFYKSPHGGAGGNRTPVHQSVNGPATTIPVCEPDAGSSAGRLTFVNARSIPGCQWSFPPPAFFLAVILRFCCRAAQDRPRAALLLTMTLHSPEIRRRERTARRQFFGLPRFTSLSNSGRIPAQAILTSKPVSPVRTYVYV